MSNDTLYARKFTGSKCPSGYVPAAELAKAMRADIKAAIKNGTLPGGMRNYSVRVDNFSGGRSINITTKGLTGLAQGCPGYRRGTQTTYADGGFSAVACGHWECENGRGHVVKVLTDEGARIEAILQAIHRSYNYDASEAQVDYFDVNFYGSAKVELA